MPYSRDKSEIGNKLGPKLIAAVTQSVIATKKGLMPTEHKLRVSAMQTVIDRAGHEVADLYAPFIDAAIAASPEMHPLVKDYLSRAASGKDQWQSLLAGTVIGQAGGSLTSIINNAIAPYVYSVVSHMSNLHIDQNAAAQAVARAIIGIGEGEARAAEMGYDPGNFGVLVGINSTPPPVDVLFDLFNRGIFSEDDVIYWMRRNGIPANIVRDIFQLHRNLLTPADAALGVLRGNITENDGLQIAIDAGYTANDFGILVANTGEPPGLEQLQEAYRRGFIDRQRLERGIRQSRVRNEWIDVIEALRYAPMSAADAIEALVKGYLSEADARKFAEQSGLEPSAFEPLRLAAGEPLSRTEMGDLVNRGEATIAEYEAAIRQSRIKDDYVARAVKLITRPMTATEAVRAFVQGYLSEQETDFIQGANGIRQVDRKPLREIEGLPLSLTQMLTLYRRGKVDRAEVKQALRESHLKDKYIDVALDLGVTLPSIFEIRLLLRDGALTDAQAAEILHEHGYQPDVITGIIHAFGNSATGANKTITESMLTNLYVESVLDRAEYLRMLVALGYTEKQSHLIAEIADWRIELQARSALLTRVRAQYVGRHIDEATAEGELYRESVPAEVIHRVMAEWNEEIKVTVKLLSEAQVVDAWFLGLFDPANPANNTSQAITYLQRLAYDEASATLLLEIKNKGPLGA